MEDEILSTFSIEQIDTSRDSVRRILSGYAPANESENRIYGIMCTTSWSQLCRITIPQKLSSMLYPGAISRKRDRLCGSLSSPLMERGSSPPSSWKRTLAMRPAQPSVDLCSSLRNSGCHSLQNTAIASSIKLQNQSNKAKFPLDVASFSYIKGKSVFYPI